MVKSTVNNVKVSVSHSKVSDSKVRKPEQVEMQMYLSKLKELVPYMPKNRKVSKVEVIEYVIDYICDLQGALEKSHPSASAVVTAMLNNMAHQQQHNNNNCLQVANANLYHNLSEPSQATRNNSTITTTSTGIVLPNRQPLVSLPATPNNAVQNSCAQEVSPLDKSPSQDSSRTVLPC